MGFVSQTKSGDCQEGKFNPTARPILAGSISEAKHMGKSGYIPRALYPSKIFLILDLFLVLVLDYGLVGALGMLTITRRYMKYHSPRGRNKGQCRWGPNPIWAIFVVSCWTDYVAPGDTCV